MNTTSVYFRSVLSVIVTVVCSSTAFTWQLSFPQDTIAYNNLFNNRQSVAFDSHGKLHVAYSGQTGTTSTTREIYYATDSSNAYATKVVTTNAVDDNYPTLVVDRNDNVHIGFLGRDGANLFQVQYSRLENGVFRNPVFITTGGVSKATPMCAIGRDSVMHFVYHTLPTSGTQYFFYRRYNLRDSSLSPEQQLTDASVTGDFDAGIAVDTSGFVHIVVKSGSVSGGPLKYYTNRTGTFVETPTGVTATVDYPRILVDTRNVVHILYRDSPSEILYLINNASGSFGSPTAVSVPGQRPSGYHNFSIDSQNRLYVVYQSSVSTSGRGWYLVHGKDGAFSDTMLVSDLPPGYVTRNTSAIAARSTREVAITYSPGAVRASLTVCDIFVKRGVLPSTAVGIEPYRKSSFALYQNYPNPFNPATRIAFSLPTDAFVTVNVFNLLGQHAATLVNENLPSGTHEVEFDASSLPSGVYFCRLRMGSLSHTRKLLLMR